MASFGRSLSSQKYLVSQIFKKTIPLNVQRCASSSSATTTSTSKPDGSSYSSEKTTHFGFKTVTEEEKKNKVLGVFENVASSYDLMNDAMSFGVHRLWKDYFVSVLNPTPDMKLLDVAGGTGDIAFRVLHQMKSSTVPSTGHVTCCDINAAMLEVGKKRATGIGFTSKDLSWQEGDAQALPFEDNTFDAYTISFGIRNVVDVQKALFEAFRVLKPGGRFLCLEFSHVDNPLMGPLYDLYSFQVIPPMGKVLAGDWDSYQYLVESIRRFPKQDVFEDMIRTAGFRFVTHENLTFGVSAIHSGFKL